VKPPEAGVGAQPVWTLLAVLGPAADYLEAVGIENARYEAELLLAHVFDLSRLDLYLQYERALSSAERDEFRELLSRRRQRVPLQQLLKEVEFLSLPFTMEEGVFIPRPETELLVEHVLGRLESDWPAGGERLGDHPLRALELGAGSGVIAVSLAVKRGDLTVWTSDVSPAALALTERNAARHEVQRRVAVEECDGLPAGNGGPVHLVVSNPPYVRPDEAESLPPEVAEHDPPAALFGGDDGLDFYRQLAAEAPARLAPGGLLAVEIGADQGEAVREIFAAAGLEGVEVLQDYAGRDRIVLASRS